MYSIDSILGSWESDFQFLRSCQGLTADVVQKYGKPMYCTRVIQDDLNPVWEETCALLVTPELIKADEQLSMELVSHIFRFEGSNG